MHFTDSTLWFNGMPFDRITEEHIKVKLLWLSNNDSAFLLDMTILSQQTSVSQYFDKRLVINFASLLSLSYGTCLTLNPANLCGIFFSIFVDSMIISNLLEQIIATSFLLQIQRNPGQILNFIRCRISLFLLKKLFVIIHAIAFASLIFF